MRTISTVTLGILSFLTITAANLAHSAEPVEMPDACTGLSIEAKCLPLCEKLAPAIANERERAAGLTTTIVPELKNAYLIARNASRCATTQARLRAIQQQQADKKLARQHALRRLDFLAAVTPSNTPFSATP